MKNQGLIIVVSRVMIGLFSVGAVVGAYFHDGMSVVINLAAVVAWMMIMKISRD